MNNVCESYQIPTKTARISINLRVDIQKTNFWQCQPNV